MVIKFGTDGWRGIIAQDYTFDNVRACTQGVANYVLGRGQGTAGLVVGYDTRFASEHFAASAAEVLAGNGIKVYLSRKAAPTPVISYNIVVHKAAGAIIITASHNPALWNGFKYKPEYAGSASPEVTAALESQISHVLSQGKVQAVPLEDAARRGLVEHIDPAAPYLEHISTLVDLEGLRSARLRVVVDSMYGAGAGYLRSLLRGSRLELVELHARRNPLFPGMVQPEPIAHNLAALSRAVVSRNAHVGLATDGDADRIGVVDEAGEFITPLQVFALLALYLLEVRGQRGPLVKSVTTTSMVYRLGELYGVPVHETPVGFKYIGPRMMAEDALIGGEESGGFGFRGHIPERDGVLSALFLLDMMVKLAKTPSQLIEHLYSKVGPHYYRRVDLPFQENRREELVQRLTGARPSRIDGIRVERLDTADGFRFVLEGGPWLIIRFSGTEPLLRIYAESHSPEAVQRLLDAARAMAGV